METKELHFNASDNVTLTLNIQDVIHIIQAIETLRTITNEITKNETGEDKEKTKFFLTDSLRIMATLLKQLEKVGSSEPPKVPSELN